jgi:hypothetical protein
MTLRADFAYLGTCAEFTEASKEKVGKEYLLQNILISSLMLAHTRSA